MYIAAASPCTSVLHTGFTISRTPGRGIPWAGGRGGGALKAEGWDIYTYIYIYIYTHVLYMYYLHPYTIHAYRYQYIITCVYIWVRPENLNRKCFTNSVHVLIRSVYVPHTFPPHFEIIYHKMILSHTFRATLPVKCGKVAP
jgi:hypothetical protein